MPLAYEEFVDFLCEGLEPERIIAFGPSEKTKQHVQELIARQKNGELLADEVSELNHFLEIEHVMRLAKARARQRLSSG